MLAIDSDGEKVVMFFLFHSLLEKHPGKVYVREFVLLLSISVQNMVFPSTSSDSEQSGTPKSVVEIQSQNDVGVQRMILLGHLSKVRSLRSMIVELLLVFEFVSGLGHYKRFMLHCAFTPASLAHQDLLLSK